jgi:hypothetical protein
MLNFGSWAACPRSEAEGGRLHAVLGGGLRNKRFAGQLQSQSTKYYSRAFVYPLSIG